MKVKITKLEAAKLQLETAIKLFFEDGDFVSIHTLARASHEILEALGKKQGKNTFIKEASDKFIVKERREEVMVKLNEAKNYFKHSDRDPDKILEFNPDFSTYFLWDAARMYHILTSGLSKEMAIYQTWFSIKNPEVLTPDQQNIINKDALDGITDLQDKKEFYRDMSTGYDTLKKLGKI